MVAVFRAVRRVLRADGIAWLNMGDCYATSSCGGGSPVDVRKDGRITRDSDKVRGREATKNKTIPVGLKPKDLCLVPSRLALALQADGWWVRSMAPWVKANPMPESCTDRPTSALESVFMLTKSARYFTDMEAVRQEQRSVAACRSKPVSATEACGNTSSGDRRVNYEKAGRYARVPGGRAYRNTDLYFQSIKRPHGAIFAGDELVGLDVNPQPFKEAHFATFPERLVLPLVKMGTSEKGCCRKCGKVWARVVKRTDIVARSHKGSRFDCGKTNARYNERPTQSGERYESRTIGWRPACECDAGDPVPCCVLDPFCGSGTTGVVAGQLGRDFTGIELNPDYAIMAEKRIAIALRPNTARVDRGSEEGGLFGLRRLTDEANDSSRTDGAVTGRGRV